MRRFEHPLEFVGAGALVLEIAAEVVDAGFKLTNTLGIGRIRRRILS